jgi:thiol:disulfide interchange protein DsbC
MTTSLLRWLLPVALLVCARVAYARAEEDQIRAAVASAMPSAQINSVTRLPYGDLFEVVMDGNKIFYTDSKGQIGLFGNLFELKTRKNLTKARIEELSVADFSKLPLDKAIVRVKGSGARKLAIFTDPDCPYCKQLEKELEAVSDITVYVFLFPLQQLHPDAPRKARAIWCAPDQAKAWDELMLNGKQPPEPATDCRTPLADIAKLAAELNIHGTPGLVFGNGRVIPGLPEPDELEQMLAE